MVKENNEGFKQLILNLGKALMISTFLAPGLLTTCSLAGINRAMQYAGIYRSGATFLRYQD